MFEGLFQPMHLLVIFWIRPARVWPQETSRTWQGHRGGYPWIQVRHERGREGRQRQTHHRRRPKLTGVNRWLPILLMMPCRYPT